MPGTWLALERSRPPRPSSPLPMKTLFVELLTSSIVLATCGCATLIGLEGPIESDSGAHPEDGLPAESTRRVFVTTGVSGGDMGGLTGADRICLDAANRAGVGGQWLAWLADDTDSPSTRFTRGEGGYSLIDGTVIATGWHDLVDGEVDAPINLDLTGSLISDVLVWSNVSVSGEAIGRMPNESCSNWAGDSDGSSGMTGDSGKIDSGWTHGANRPCTSQLHLYCFEQ